jgi:hypothetical protein
MMTDEPVVSELLKRSTTFGTESILVLHVSAKKLDTHRITADTCHSIHRKIEWFNALAESSTVEERHDE